MDPTLRAFWLTLFYIVRFSHFMQIKQLLKYTRPKAIYAYGELRKNLCCYDDWNHILWNKQHVCSSSNLPRLTQLIMSNSKKNLGDKRNTNGKCQDYVSSLSRLSKTKISILVRNIVGMCTLLWCRIQYSKQKEYHIFSPMGSLWEIVRWYLWVCFGCNIGLRNIWMTITLWFSYY